MAISRERNLKAAYSAKRNTNIIMTKPNKESEIISPYQNYQNIADSGTVASSFFIVVFEIIKTIIIVGCLALLLRIYLIQPFIVEGSSMSKTLSNNDYLLIDKVSYRLHPARRGDIIVFRYPKNPKLNYIKRVIGLPGERIKITPNAVEIFNNDHPVSGIKLDESYLKDPRGKMINGYQKSIEVEIPENQYFVMGDNRLGSSDSREWGLLPKANIIGRSLVRLFPIQDFEIIDYPTYSTPTGS